MKYTKIHRNLQRRSAMRLNIAALLCAGIAVTAMFASKAEEVRREMDTPQPQREAVRIETVSAAVNVREIKTRFVAAQGASEREAELTYWEEIPLDADIQDHIFAMCEQRGIDPVIVFAIIQRESQYQPDAIGDNGNAYGLMQVQERYHSGRMAELGCNDLMNPLQNVTVGIDYLDEMLERGNGVEWALTAYNRGATGAYRCGGKSAYATDVLAEAERMKTEVYFG